MIPITRLHTTNQSPITIRIRSLKLSSRSQGTKFLNNLTRNHHHRITLTIRIPTQLRPTTRLNIIHRRHPPTVHQCRRNKDHRVTSHRHPLTTVQVTTHRISRTTHSINTQQPTLKVINRKYSRIIELRITRQKFRPRQSPSTTNPRHTYQILAHPM